MCNFIIRPIKSYATVDLFLQSAPGVTTRLYAGEYVTVKEVDQHGVVLASPSGENFEDKELVWIPMNVFVHVFSDKDPNAKEAKKA